MSRVITSPYPIIVMIQLQSTSITIYMAVFITYVSNKVLSQERGYQIFPKADYRPPYVNFDLRTKNTRRAKRRVSLVVKISTNARIGWMMLPYSRESIFER